MAKNGQDYVANNTVSSESGIRLSELLDLVRAQFEEQRRSGSKTTHGRSKLKLSTEVNRGVQERAKRDIAVVEDEVVKRQQKLIEKAKIYDAIQRGAYDDDETRDRGEGIGGLILPPGHDDKSESSDDYDDDDMVEVEDSFGRTRKVPRGKQHLYEQGFSSGEEDDFEQRRPMVERPSKILRGSVVQHEAFHVDEVLAENVRVSGHERVEEVHYDASWEIRDRGVGFFQFSQDAEERRRNEMEELKQIRSETLASELTRASVDAKQACKDRLAKRFEAIKRQREKTMARLRT